MSSPEAAKKRILPAWMTKNVAEPEEWAKMRSKRRKKTALVRYAAYLFLKNQRRMGCSKLPFLPPKAKLGGGVCCVCRTIDRLGDIQSVWTLSGNINRFSPEL